MKTSFSQMFGEALGRVLDKGDFVEGEHPRGHGGKFARKMGATERAPAYSLKKYKAGGGTSYRMYVGRKLVGHISGFEEDKKIDGVWTPVFHIYRAFMDEGMRGKGMYRSAVQVVANQYAGGAYVHIWEASGDLKRALGKLPTHRIDEENERIRVLPEGKPEEKPKEPPKRVGRDYDTAQVFMDTVKEKHPGAAALFMPMEDGTIELVTISIPEGEQSKGKGSAVMRDIIALADSKGVTLVLKVAEAKEVGEKNRARLFEFYKRFGFVLNDAEKYNKRNSDMYREPVGKPEKPISKDGTTEGAIQGWETRRRGGPPIPLKGYFLSAKTRIRDLAQESVDELKQEIENNRRRIATPYMDMIRRDDARRRQGYEIVREAAQRLADIQPHPGDAEKRAMLLQYAEQRAERVSQRDGEKSWDEEFSDYLTAAGEIAERVVSQVH